MKQCCKCKELKPIEQFYKRSDGRSKDNRAYVCSDCNKAQKKKWYKSNKRRPEVRFKCCKSEAKQRGLEVTLTLEEFKSFISKNCHYCNADMSKHIGVGLDRLNNDLGYTKENVVSCCTACNRGRCDNFSPEEWQIMIDALKNWRKTRVPTPTPD